MTSGEGLRAWRGFEAWSLQSRDLSTLVFEHMSHTGNEKEGTIISGIACLPGTWILAFVPFFHQTTCRPLSKQPDLANLSQDTQPTQRRHRRPTTRLLVAVLLKN